MISNETGFAALHMSNHVPFYPTLRCKRLNFHDTFLGIILTEELCTRFDRSLRNFDWLRLGDHHQADPIWIAVAFARRFFNLLKSLEITFADCCNKVGHMVIIIAFISRFDYAQREAWITA